MTHPDRADHLATIRSGKVARVNGLVAGTEEELDFALSRPSSSKPDTSVPVRGGGPPETDGLEERGVTIDHLRKLAESESIEIGDDVKTKAQLVAAIRSGRAAKDSSDDDFSQMTAEAIKTLAIEEGIQVGDGMETAEIEAAIRTKRAGSGR